MSVRNLDKIFRPRRIAVIGASPHPQKVGHTVFHNLLGAGFAGVVYPINPQHESVQGVQAYPRIADLPATADLAIVCTPAATVATLVHECGIAGVRGMVILSAGFRETGPAGQAMERELRDTTRAFDAMRIIGPNCLGVMVPGLGLNASFAATKPLSGRLAFLSQSGALCTAVLDWANDKKIGFSHFVSLGNMLDVGVADMIDYLAADPETDAILLYLESLTNPRQFMSAARAFTRHKPIVVCKAGRFTESAHAAASHTGAMAGVDAVYDAAFQRAGMVRVDDIEELFACAELLARQRLPSGPRLAVVTNAGGPGVMAADAILSHRGELASLSPTTMAKLSEALPPFWSHGNPVDVLGDAPAERYMAAVAAVIADPQVDGLLVILTPQAMTDAQSTATAIAQVAADSTKPVLAVWMGGQSLRAAVEHLNTSGIPTYEQPEAAVRAFMYLVAFARNRQLLCETPRKTPLALAFDRHTRRAALPAEPPSQRTLLTTAKAKSLFAAYGLPVTATAVAGTIDQAVQAAQSLGYPVVMKVISPDVSHKTDVGGVELNLGRAEEVVEAWTKITTKLRATRPEARFEGVTVEPMVTAPYGFELMLGTKQDPVFGAVMMVAAGGIATEVLADRALGLPPLNERLARHMLESLRSWPLLSGYRGRPAANIERLIEVLIRFSCLVAECPEVVEAEANPLLVTPTDVLALDVRVILGAPLVSTPAQSYGHLAIRPYPDELVHTERLKDGTSLLFRPIMPEDEPRWRAFLAGCSEESLRHRFRYSFKEATHEMAARFCFIDYDREIALVAELPADSTFGSEMAPIIGVGRLVADADHNAAEYAALVTDAWQGRGIGGALLDNALRIARDWGLKRVFGETESTNRRMIATFRSRGFEFSTAGEPGVVLATKQIV